MSANTVLLVCIFAFLSVSVYACSQIDVSQNQIAVACVSNGGEWLRNWGQYECQRPEGARP